MGVTYEFRNQTLRVWNKEKIPDHYGSSIGKFNDCYDEEGMIKVFENVISVNDTWSKGHILAAIPDYPEYETIYYWNGKIVTEEEIADIKATYLRSNKDKVHYCFFNSTLMRVDRNDQPKKYNLYDEGEGEIISVFKSVIEENGWKEEHDIRAIPSDPGMKYIVFCNGKLI